MLTKLKFIKMEHNKLNRSELICNRLIECDENGELMYREQLKIIHFYLKKFNFTSKSNLAKQRGVSASAISQSIKRGREMVLELNGVTLIAN